MEEIYFEIWIQPYCYKEAFLDFIVDHIQSCIEEIETPYVLEGHNADVTSWDLTRFFPKEEQKYEQIVVRTSKDPQSILDSLNSFAQILSRRLEERIEFGFGYKVCKNQDWIEAYRQSILPVCVGEFYIRPSWHPKSTHSGLKDIVIDPALAFGSGHHATTSMCLEFLCDLDLQEKRLLDVGCGSGILSIGASMLGANVDLCDTDPLAIQESSKNFKLNQQSFANAWVGSIALASENYDVIVANIVSSILIILKSDFHSKLKSGGTLILSGILEEYKELVLESFVGFKNEKISQKDEWLALKLIKV